MIRNVSRESKHRSQGSKRIACVLALLMLLTLAMPASAAPLPMDPSVEDLVQLKVLTPTYRWQDGRIVVDGYDQVDLPGAPLLPRWSTLVPLPSDGEWSLGYRAEGSHELVIPHALPAVPVRQLDLQSSQNPQEIGDLAPIGRLVDQPNPLVYEHDGLFPASPVQAGPELWRRGQRLLAVHVFPFQYNPVRGILAYHPELTITITLAPAAARPASEHRKPQPRPQPTDGEQGAVRVYTSQRGLYRLTHASLAQAGVPLDTVAPASFVMTYLGQPIDILVTGSEDGRFDPEDTVIFYAQPYDGRYMAHNVYRLSYGGSSPGQRMGTRSIIASGDEPLITTITRTLHVEFDQDYRSTYERPQDADHWFDKQLYVSNFSPDTTTASVAYALALEDPVTTADPELRILVHGGVDQAADPDQSVAVRFNSYQVGVHQWEGSADQAISARIPAAALSTNGSDSVFLEAATNQLPGLDYYWVSPDWVEVGYQSMARARNGRLFVEAIPLTETGDHRSAHLVITGFDAAPVRVVDVRNPLRPVLITSVELEETPSDILIHFWDQWDEGDIDPTYYLSAESGLLAPVAVERDVPSHWRSAEPEADYIAIVHPLLWDAVQPLLDHRAAEGLRVAKVNVQDVYDEFSFGRVDPEAIRDFLAYAYHYWNRGESNPPGYVLLVGDGHYDFKNVAGTGLPNLIPPYLVHVDPWIGETAADNRYVSIDGPDDYMADMAIGRIPAQTPADVTALVDKILAYEAHAPSGDWQKRAVFVADYDGQEVNDFHNLSDQVRLNFLPLTYQSRTIYLQSSAKDEIARVQSAIRQAYDDGAVYLQWFGHGSPFRWGYSAPLLDILGPPALAPNTQLPFSAHYACWSGYFIGINGSQQYDHDERSLGEVLVLTPGRGSVADLAPAGLHIGSALLKLNEGIVDAMFVRQVRRVGDVVDEGKAYFVSKSLSFHDVVDTSILFGDPAMKLRRPSTGLSQVRYFPVVMGD